MPQATFSTAAELTAFIERHDLFGELLREALLGAVSVMVHVGGRAMLVDAISDQARRFYENLGFEPSPVRPMMCDLHVVARSAGLEASVVATARSLRMDRDPERS